MAELIIDRLETAILDLPFRRLQRFAALGARKQSTVLVRLGAKNGLEGIGEAVTPSGPWWGGESVESIKTTLDTYVAPILIGANALCMRDLMLTFDQQVYGNTWAKAALEMALFDLLGKYLGQPIHVLLGGGSRKSVYTSWPLATGEPSQEIEEAEEKLTASEARCFKIKMGALELREDVARVLKIADALGGRASIRVDPNERWSEIDARWAAPRLQEAGIEMIEQPFPRWDLDAAARFVQYSQMTVMLDESVRTPQDMITVANKHAAGLVSLKLMKSGGIGATRRLADIAVATGTPLYMGTFLETSLGTAAAMQLCATLDKLPFGSELIGPMLIAEDIVLQTAQYHDNQLWLEPGPGLGVDLDEDKVAAFRRDKSSSLHSMSVRHRIGEAVALPLVGNA